MNNSPLIHIIVPVYNVEPYLSKCVDSLLAQTYKNIHITLVDDGSTDHCPAICDAYAQKDTRIHVIHRANGGQAAARNTALDEIFRSFPVDEYVAFVDSDDYVTPDYIAFLYDLMTRYKADIAQCGHYTVYSDKRVIAYSNRRTISKNHVKNVTVMDTEQALQSLCYTGAYDVGMYKLYKLRIWKDIRFPEGRIYEDTAVAHLVAEQARKIVVDMTPKYYYVQRYNSTANGTVFHEKKYEYLQAGDELADAVTAKYPHLARAANVKRVFVRLSTLSQMVNANYYDAQRVKEMREVVKHYAPDVLWNRKSPLRDKLGTLLFLMGFPFYRAVWKLYYKFMRRK